MKRIFIHILILAVLVSGCSTMNKPEPEIVQTKGTSDISLSKGVVYRITAWVKNNGASGNVRVTAELISNTGAVRDTDSKVIYIEKGQTVKVEFVLDGEAGIRYTYKVRAEAI